MYRKRRGASGDDNGPLCRNQATREQGSCQPKGVQDGSSNVVNQWKVETRRQASGNFDRKWGVGSGAIHESKEIFRLLTARACFSPSLAACVSSRDALGMESSSSAGIPFSCAERWAYIEPCSSNSPLLLSWRSLLEEPSSFPPWPLT